MKKELFESIFREANEVDNDLSIEDIFTKEFNRRFISQVLTDERKSGKNCTKN